MKSTVRGILSPNGSPRENVIKRAAAYLGMPHRAELIVAFALVLFVIVLKCINVLHFSFDRDEAQHLHVIWERTLGLVPYRDFFDNHMPLFHILFAPIVALVGERPTILYWMRFILLPMYVVVLWCTYDIGQRLFSRRAGLWAVIGLAFFSKYSTAIQFRTDNLWAPLWLLCVVVLLRGVIGPGRALIAGLLLGLCFGVSMKSIVFLVALLVSAPLTLILARRHKRVRPRMDLLACAAAFLLGTGAVPAVIMLFYALQGIWREFRYSVFEFNFLANVVYQSRLVYKTHPVATAIILALALLLIIPAGRSIMRVTADSGQGARRLFILLLCLAYMLTLRLFWPPISRTYPPIYPLVFILLSGALFNVSDRLSRSDWNILRVFRFMPLPVFAVVAELIVLLVRRPIFRDRTRHETGMLRSLLALTTKDDYVLDCKGETIFRRRCYWPVLERITMKAMAAGLMSDTAPQRCIETRTCVVATMLMQRYPASTRLFVERNYLPVGNKLSAAGKILQPGGPDLRRYDFEVAIPSAYQLLARDGSVAGKLDDMPWEGARFLGAGPHHFDSSSAAGPLALLWAQAAERNFAPTGYRLTNYR